MFTAFLFALNRESRPFTRGRQRTGVYPSAPCPTTGYRVGSEVVLVMETGVGSDAAGKAMDWLLDQPARPKLVVSAGFAAAANPEWRVGTVVVANAVLDVDGNDYHLPIPMEIGDYPVGRLLTSATVITKAATKERLRAAHHIDLIDMEAVGVADRCAFAHVPFVAVKAVSDDAFTSLSPAVTDVLADGRVSVGRVLRTLARRPATVREFWRLGRDTRRAADNLAAAMEFLVTGKNSYAIVERRRRRPS